MRFLNAIVLRRAASRIALAAATAACGSNANIVTPPSDGETEWLRITGPYTFALEVDTACGWPINRFYWPVFVEVDSYGEGITSGWIVFPPSADAPSRKWNLYAGPTRTQLIPAEGSPGPTPASGEVIVEGGRWEAGGPTRAPYNRGEIANGTSTGARQILIIRSSGKQWECRADLKWSLLTRYVD